MSKNSNKIWKQKYPEKLKQQRKRHYLKYREFIIDLKSNDCAICGYNEYIGALDFHHVNPKDKKYSANRLQNHSIEKIIEEINKCILLCRNCHAEIERRKYK